MSATLAIRRGLLSVFVTLLWIGSYGCATTATGSGSESRDVAELKRRVLELQQQARKSELEIARLRQKVAALEARAGVEPRRATDLETPAARRAPTVTPPASRQVTEPAERASPRNQPLLEEIDLDEPEPTPSTRRRPRTEPTVPPESPTPPDRVPPTEPVVVPGTPSGTPTGTDAQALYDEGYTQFHRQRYLDAEATFQRFLRTYGDTSLADNAQYWIGEARFARGDLRGALAAFRETIERYPEGNKVPDALFKAGQTLEALGDVEGARETYREVIRRFPEGPTAGKAEERLDELP